MIRKETESRPAPVSAEPSTAATDPSPRRTFLASLTTIVLATIALGTPLVAGVAMFLDPLIRRANGGGEGRAGKLTRITTLDALPLDGSPVQFAIMEDKVDAWNREPNQPVGSIFLRRLANQVLAFNAVCPHAGCYVAYSAAREVFRCPCHNSSFELDGERIETPAMANPSPRPLDMLDVEYRLPGIEKAIDEKAAALATTTVEVWVRFQNYKAGTAQKIAD
ncbi:MAG TPA: Rieske 2Fe-2S domain-containing protein [Pirellulaceae bacterium]|jgi:Rieske Fe-S protein|nr:Rieske 2Fe-2S domain-containing protein [Pirellulaceae bacterium]